MITILYSSGGGNTRMVCDYISSLCAGYDFVLQNIVTATPEILNQGTIVVLAAPTYDHGVLHAPFERFLDNCKEISLEKHYVVVGLGDSKYDKEYAVESAPILEAFVIEHGGVLLCDTLKIDKNPVSQLDSYVKQWIEEHFLPALKNL